MLQKWPEAGSELLSWWQIFFPPHPGAWPFIQIGTVTEKIEM
jgi:hypothetical protein